MKKTMLSGFCAMVVSIGLIGCGGSSSDSSFSSTKTFNGTTYTCTAQSSFDKCLDGNSCVSAGCTSNASNSNTTNSDSTVVTAVCASTGTQLSVPTTGCVGTLLGSQYTMVCMDKSTNSVKSLGGTGKTVADVKNATSGTVNISGGSSLNGQTLVCS